MKIPLRLPGLVCVLLAAAGLGGVGDLGWLERHRGDAYYPPLGSAPPLALESVKSSSDGFPGMGWKLCDARGEALWHARPLRRWLVSEETPPGWSLELRHRIQPEWRLRVLLAPKRTFMPDLSEASVRGYLVGRLRKYRTLLEVPPEAAFTQSPRVLAGLARPWVPLSYTVHSETAGVRPRVFREILIKLEEEILFLRLEGEVGALDEPAAQVEDWVQSLVPPEDYVFEEEAPEWFERGMEEMLAE